MFNNKRAICWVYDNWHSLSTYVLLTGKNPKGHKVLEDNQKRFDDNLKDKVFKKDVEMFKTAIQTTDEIFLKESYILDFGFFTYITKDKYWLFKYKPASLGDRLKCRGSYIVIQSYKDLDIQFIDQGKKKPKMLQLFWIVYCPVFLFNIVSFQQLKERGID